jgi:hypothetical protein
MSMSLILWQSEVRAVAPTKVTIGFLDPIMIQRRVPTQTAKRFGDGQLLDEVEIETGHVNHWILCLSITLIFFFI